MNNRAIGSFKIPSILFYDRDGSFRGPKGTLDEEEIENLHELRWWVSLMCIVTQVVDTVSGGS